jgi:hypothetical protein
VYQPVNGQWKLFGLNVAMALAPASPPQASAAPKTQPADPAASAQEEVTRISLRGSSCPSRGPEAHARAISTPDPCHLPLSAPTPSP